MRNLITIRNMIKSGEVKNLTANLDTWGLSEDAINILASVNPDNEILGGRGNSVTKKIRITKDTTELQKQQIITFLDKVQDCKKQGIQVEYVMMNDKNEYFTHNGKVEPEDLFNILADYEVGA